MTDLLPGPSPDPSPDRTLTPGPPVSNWAIYRTSLRHCHAPGPATACPGSYSRRMYLLIFVKLITYLFYRGC